jgi:DNA mismatch repair ATPase MutS
MRFYTQRQITSWLLFFDNKSIGISFLDVSTGEFLASQGRIYRQVAAKLQS